MIQTFFKFHQPKLSLPLNKFLQIKRFGSNGPKIPPLLRALPKPPTPPTTPPVSPNRFSPKPSTPPTTPPNSPPTTPPGSPRFSHGHSYQTVPTLRPRSAPASIPTSTSSSPSSAKFNPLKESASEQQSRLQRERLLQVLHSQRNNDHYLKNHEIPTPPPLPGPLPKKFLAPLSTHSNSPKPATTSGAIISQPNPIGAITPHMLLQKKAHLKTTDRPHISQAPALTHPPVATTLQPSNQIHHIPTSPPLLENTCRVLTVYVSPTSTQDPALTLPPATTLQPSHAASYPPTPPPMPPVKPVPKSGAHSNPEGGGSVTPQMLAQGKANLKTLYVNPKGDARDTVSKKGTTYSLKSIEGVPYETIIDAETTPSNIEDSVLISEMRKRSFVKEDKANTESTMISDSGEKLIVGKNTSDVKLTPRGQSYNNATFKKAPNPDNHVPADLNSNRSQLILPSTDEELCLIKTGMQNHVHIVKKGNDGFFYSAGYLTGSKEGTFINEEKFTTFQEKQEHNKPLNPPNNKSQHLAEYKNLVKISEQEATVLKYGTEYLNSVNNKKFLDKNFEKLSKKPFVDYEAVGITKQKAIDMCLEYDRRVSQNIEHPKTVQELNQQEKNLSKDKQVKLTKQNDAE